jgi:hypothetical protein
MFFAFNNPKLAQANHLQLQVLLFLPLIVILILIFFQNAASLSETKAFGLLSLAGLCINVQLLTAFYIGWFFIFWCLLFFSLCIFCRETRLFIWVALDRHRRAIIASGVVFLLSAIPFLVVYLPVMRTTGGYSYDLAIRYIPEIKSYFLMADSNYIWAGLTDAILRRYSLGTDWGRRVGIGIVPSVVWVGISAFGIWVIKEYIKPSSVSNSENIDVKHCNKVCYLFWALMILAVNVLFIIGLQYRGHSLWKFVYLLLPGARSIRQVSRFVMVLSLPMAIAFAFAVQHGMRKIALVGNFPARTFLSGVMYTLIAVGLFEQFNSGEGQYYSIRAENTRLKDLAAKLPEDCSSFYIAEVRDGDHDQEYFGNENYMHDAMLVSVLKQLPTLNGRSGLSPPDWSLREVNSSEYEDKVRQWVKRHNIEGKVCRLEVDE